jgi:hypothetical protein
MLGRLLGCTALVLTFAAGTARGAAAQEYGPHRTLLMVGAYGAGYRVDAGEGQERADLLGGGGRLLMNLAPLSGPGNTLLDMMVLGGFVFYGSGDDVSVLHSGGELDLHFAHNPLGGFLDPFVQLGVGRFRMRADAAGTGLRAGREANLALSPGAGLRIARRGMLEFRADARDVIIFGNSLTGGSGERTTHNLEITAGAHLRF